jgi:hypothetical protein
MIAGLLATLGLTAGAQTPPPAPTAGPNHTLAQDAHAHADPARHQERMARMQEHRAKRLSEFKQQLQLSPGQEGAWNSYVAALQPSGEHKRFDRAALAALTTPERIDRMRALRADRIAAMDRRGEATKAFYATLTPQQKQLFDQATARRGGHGHHGRHHIG